MEILKKGSSASKRAMTELRSNGTDNNQDARGRNAEGTDKREQLKKDFFEIGGSFEDLSSDNMKSEGKTEKAVKSGVRVEDTFSYVAASNLAREKGKIPDAVVGSVWEKNVLSSEKGKRSIPSEKQRIPMERSVQRVSAEPIFGPRPVGAKKANHAGASPSREAEGATAGRPVAQTPYGVKGAETRVAKGPAFENFGMSRSLQNNERAKGIRPSVEPQRNVSNGIPSRDAVNVASGKERTSHANSDTPSKKTPVKKKNTRKIITAVASAFLVVAVAVSLVLFFYLNREEEFVPADVVAGNPVSEVSGYSQLLPSETVSYLTEERYSVRFTFYEQPEIVCTTKEITVGELMDKLGITVGEDNRCSVASDELLSADSTVDIQTITYETVSKEEAIPYETEYVDVRTIPKGTTKVSENGKNGIKTYTYKCTLVNGVEESRELIGETVTQKPKSRVMYRGVGGTITSQGRTYKYSYYIDVKATCYSIVGTTASGLPTSVSVMAVDPRVIPLGTKCVVVGGGDYGYRVAADTGGDIKGNKIDLWYPAGTFNGFGWRNTRVYILE